MQWVFLGIAILLEVCGTTLMKLSDGFTKMIYAAPIVSCGRLTWGQLAAIINIIFLRD
ncbi:SMR family transporter [Methylomusa anaerophila]|uniref:SMR family transporter n=1 Tax=Methylomusa anaerophila TaxID=1930071 RepID=UPI000F824E4C|nr:SMR family transporter [Methylomusa anaerophila]